MTTEDEAQARSLFAAGNFAAAEPLFARLAQAHPGDAVAQYNLGVVLAKLDRPEPAIACYRAAIELNPAFADAYCNIGSCLNQLNLIAQARQAFDLARRLKPDDPIPILNSGIAALALGDYAPGWQGFAARWRLPAYGKFRRDFPQPQWRGENLSAKRLFLYAEQGFGDSIQMARFLPRLAERGASVMVEAQPALADLLRSAPGAAQVIAKGESIPDFDLYSAMMDIPAALGVTLDTLPTTTPYLYADPALTAHYRDLLPADGKRRVGLSWAGRASHENDRNRSLSLAQLVPLLSHADCHWISLQRVVPDCDSADLATSAIKDWGQGFADFAATAAAIMALDLVITVDTAIAHLAGALGKPVWILLPFHADWRWLTGRADSPWYPTATLFRQHHRGDWAGVIAKLIQALLS